MSYFHTDPSLDFDEANAFIAALADTVPSLDKSSDWNKDFDLDKLYSPELDAKFNPSSPEVISSNGSIDEMFVGSSNDSDFSTSLPPFYSRDGDLFVPEEANDSLASTVSPLLEFSPHSGTSSLRSPCVEDKIPQHSGLTEDISSLDFSSMGAIPNFTPQSESKMINFAAPPHESAGGRFDGNSPRKSHVKRELSSETENANDVKPTIKASKVSKPERKPKTSHNVIEKKYRTSINSKILELREVVPTLKFATGKARISMADLDGLSPASKLNKASILTKANEYIKHMKKKNKTLQKEIQELQALVNSAESTTQTVDVSPSATQRSFQTSLDAYANYLGHASDCDSLYDRRVTYNSSADDGVFSNYSTFSDMNSRDVSMQPTQNNSNTNQNSNTNMFLGGLATLMGSSYINDNNFQAMSAMPLFPATLFGQSASATQLISSLRMCVAGVGIFMMAYSIIGGVQLKPGKGKERHTPESVAWVLSVIGIKPRDFFDDQAKKEVTDRLIGANTTSAGSWYKTYFSLRTKESNFETILLQFLVGTVIVKKGLALSNIIALDLKLKKRSLLTAEYSGNNDSLKSLRCLFSTIDGLSMFESETFAERLFNLAHRKPISRGIANGENASLFVDSILRNENNLYGILFEWRVLEIIHELTLVYLDLIASTDGVRDEDLGELKSDARKLGQLVNGSKYLGRQLSYFEMLLSPESTPEVLQNDRHYILNTLSAVTSSFQEPELTDDELISDDESVEESETSSASIDSEQKDPLQLIKHQKSIVCSLNLMNEEKFIVLLSSLISYYSQNEDEEKSLELLNHLKLKESKNSLSLLSFTCLLKLLLSLVQTEKEESTETNTSASKNCSDIAAHMSSQNCLILESLIKVMRSWLNEDNKPVFLTHKLRSELSNLVITRGIALNKL
ncbi:hypothetical protein JCM33374_g2702 [Metschnikowia sp. JCM 33374]|nr:hypothetical protein JCM33374_g2702 [Metschnikowia sp. JCM 33374]